MITQTLLGRVLCRLGIHHPIISGGNPHSMWGGCIRCNRTWQWDNTHPSRWEW